MSLFCWHHDLHCPGITARADRADPAVREPFYAALGRLRDRLERSRPDGLLIVIAAEHFANFFINNMPALRDGMADEYEGPIEIRSGSGSSAARYRARPSSRVASSGKVMETVDVAYAEEWKCPSRDHGPPQFSDAALRPSSHSCKYQLPGLPLTPLSRAYEFGAIRWRLPSDWSCRHGWTALAGDPQLGKDQRRVGPRIPTRWTTNDREGSFRRTDAGETLRDAGQGGFDPERLLLWPARAKVTEGKRGSANPSQSSRRAASWPSWT